MHRDVRDVLWMMGGALIGFILGALGGRGSMQRSLFARTTNEGAPTVVKYLGVYYRCTELLDVEEFIDQEKEGE